MDMRVQNEKMADGRERVIWFYLHSVLVVTQTKILLRNAPYWSSGHGWILKSSTLHTKMPFSFPIPSQASSPSAAASLTL
jgi:hypothetical protein